MRSALAKATRASPQASRAEVSCPGVHSKHVDRRSRSAGSWGSRVRIGQLFPTSLLVQKSFLSFLVLDLEDLVAFDSHSRTG